MVLTLYGYPSSPNAKYVAFLLHEKKVPFAYVEIDVTKGEHKLPIHLARQPFGEVPYLEDDGFFLYEGRAMARYIADKYADQGPVVIPTGLKPRALFEQAASVEKGDFHEFASKIAFEGYFKRLFGQPVDELYIASHTKTLAAKLDVYEQILGKQKYVAGDEFTLIDMFHAPWIQLLPLAGCNLIEERPNLARWAKSVTDRPAWQAVKDGVAGTI